MLNRVDASEQKKRNIRMLIIAIIIMIVVLFVITIPLAFYYHDLMTNATKCHYIFSDIDELNEVESLKLLSAEQDVFAYDIKVADEMIYSYCDGEVSLCAYVIDDITHIHDFIRNVVGDADVINEEFYFGYKIIVAEDQVKYLIFNGKNVLMANTNFGEEKMDEFIGIIDNELTIAVSEKDFNWD